MLNSAHIKNKIHDRGLSGSCSFFFFFLGKAQVSCVHEVSYFELNLETYKGVVVYGRRGEAPRFLAFSSR
jgi:hypothetical protein